MKFQTSALLGSLSALLASVLGDYECPVAPSNPGDRRTDTSNLRIMQFNAEWLFVDPYNGCPGTSCPWANTSIAAEHLSAVASVVAQYNPDIVNFCEIEGCDELDSLVSHLGPSYNYKPYLKQGTDTSTGQNVGLLTRIDPSETLWRTAATSPYPVSGSQCGYTGSSGTKGCSKHYFTSFNVNGMNIAFIGAHLLAYPTDPSRCVQREAQATTLRNVIDTYVSRGYEVVVLGDFNDYDAEATDAMGDQPTSKVLDILKAKGTAHELVNVAAFVAPSERYSDWWDSNNDCVYSSSEVSMIDHILLSANLASKVTKVTYAHAAYAQSCNDLYSDHWPVIVDLHF